MALILDDLEMIQERLRDLTYFPAARALEESIASTWIASGLAKISAAYGAELVEKYAGLPSRLMSTLDYCQKPRLRTLPILVSLKGRHEDAVSVTKSIVSRLSPASILITGESDGLAAKTLNKEGASSFLVSNNFPKRDHRFVNCKSIFMLSALVYNLVKQAFGINVINSIDEFQLKEAFFRANDEANKIAQSILAIHNWQNNHFIILGQGLGSDLTLSWQSIFSEAAICTLTCLDMKDYTHGDHLAAVRLENFIFLVLQNPGSEDIVDIFVSRFSTRFPVLVVPLKLSGAGQFWENLFYCCNTAEALTDYLGYGGRRPPKDPIVHGWRGWGNLL